jgi:hypothetical protein
MNQVVPPGYEKTVAHYVHLLAGQYLSKVGRNPFVDPFLMNVGGAVFEYFAPVDMNVGMGKQFASIGGYLHGCEFRIPDLEEATALSKEHGVRILIDSRPDFVMTHPADCFGFVWELYTGDWYSEAASARYVELMRPQSYWRDVHPLGIKEFGYRMAVNDLNAAVSKLSSFVGARELERVGRTNAAGTAALMSLANITIEVVAPTGAGPVQAFLDHYDQRAQAMLFKVKDLNAVRQYFSRRGVQLEPGIAEGSLQVPPAQNLGVSYEFYE